MLKFAEIPYHRPDLDSMLVQLDALTNGICIASSFEECFCLLISSDQLDQLFVSYAVISEAGNTNNTLDDFFQGEEAFFQEAKPRWDFAIKKRNQSIYESPYRDSLMKALGRDFFDRIAMQSKTASDRTLSLLKNENSLSQEYSDIMSQLTVNVDGVEVSLPALDQLMSNADHTTRKARATVIETALSKVSPNLDDLFDKLCHIRTDIARQTGFSDYTNYSLCKHARTSYGRTELQLFANLVEQHIVPLVSELMRNQEERLGHPILNYDEGFPFSGKSPRVPESPLDAFVDIFGQLSAETKVFFDELVEREFFDLEVRVGKVQGAYSNNLPLARMPYIFQTYNATEGALQTFAHECGHGLHTYLHRGDELVCAQSCGSDVAEIHSISMEYFVWNYLDKVMGPEHLDHYKYRQLQSALIFIAYGTAIDQFQTMVYDRPDLSPQGRLDLWQQLERRFLPWRKYEDGLFFSQGRAWQRQIHVMKWPFYFIDYVLAHICALQYCLMDELDHTIAWENYMQLMKNSGRFSFAELIKMSNLRSPFEEDFIRQLTKSIKSKLRTLEKGR